MAQRRQIPSGDMDDFPASTGNPEDEVWLKRLTEQAREMLAELTPSERAIMKLRFGIGLNDVEGGGKFRTARARIAAIKERGAKKSGVSPRKKKTKKKAK